MNKSLYFGVEVLSTTVLFGNNGISTQHNYCKLNRNLLKNPKQWKANTFQVCMVGSITSADIRFVFRLAVNCLNLNLNVVCLV